MAMKSLPLILIILSTMFCMYNQTSAQTCTVSTSGMTFADVTALESFLASQVAGMNCSEIEIIGSIQMDCTTSPTSLNFVGSNIDKVVDISAQLRVFSCNSITSISGFNNLKEVLDLTIRENDALEAISGFPNLQEVSRFFSVVDNQSLLVIDDFEKLTYVGDDILISSNNVLLKIGFPSLRQTGDFLIDGELLSNIGVFPELSLVAGTFSFNGTSLTTLGSFPKLLSAGSLNIRNNDEMSRIGDFPNLCRLNAIQISNNTTLTELGNFSQLRFSSSMIIESNDSLLELGDFSSLENAVGMIIRNNDSLSNLGDFSKLKYVDGRLQVSNNNSLISIESFPNLDAIRNDLEIRDNINLISIGDFPSLSQIGYLCSACDFRIINNPKLSNTGIFPNLCSVEGEFIVKNNPLLNACCVFRPVLNTGSILGLITIEDNGINCGNEASIISNCSNSAPPTICLPSFTYTLDACNRGVISIGDFISGPSCGFVPSISGIPTFNNVTFSLDEDDIGNHTVIVDNGVDSPCMIALTIVSTCQDDIVIAGPISSGLYEASQTVTSDGNLNSSPVDFSAGTCIQLDPNFEVQSGNVFSALIEGCNN